MDQKELNAKRDEIAGDVERFLQAGGTIDEIGGTRVDKVFMIGPGDNPYSETKQSRKARRSREIGASKARIGTS